MKNNSKPSRLRLSPNELQNLVKQERDKWRIFRIQQVREQAKDEARRVREAVSARKKMMIELLSREVKQHWEAEKENKIIQLEKEYQDCIRNIGWAHRLATQQPDPNKVLQQQAQHNRRLAILRGQEADRQQQEEVKQQQHLQNRLQKKRQEAVHLEKLRAKHVANLPVPEAFTKKTVVEEKPQQRVAFHEAGTFTTTHYVPQNIRVEKEVWSSKPNAKELAAAEQAERGRLERERRKQEEEDYVKREQRGKEALRKEQLTHLLQHLTARLDDAQRQHYLSHLLNGKDGIAAENKDIFVKEQNHQQREMEEAVENLLQKKIEEREEKKEEYHSPDSYQLSSEYLEEIGSSEGSGQAAITGTKVRGLRSLLMEVERRRRRILQELEDSVPVRGPTDLLTCDDKGDDSNLEDTARSIYFANTVPVHLHPGHPPTRDPLEDTGNDQTSSSSSIQSEESTTELPDSSSAVLPLSEESIPLSIDKMQPSTTPSLSHRCSTCTEPRETHVRLPNLAKPHTTVSDTSSVSSDEIKINVDLEISSSSHVGCDSTVENTHHQEQQTESLISSTEYYSPPSELPRRQLSLQEIEDNLKRIQKNREHNWNCLNHLSWKRGVPGSHTPITTYVEKLKEEGTGKKPITRKEKFERQKRELIQFYIRRLLQKGDHEGDLSASTVEGFGLSISSLGSLLSYLEGEREKDQSTDLPSTSSAFVTSSSTSLKLHSAYEDIDEFPVRMSREHVYLPSQVTTIPTAQCPIHIDPHHTAETVITPITIPFSSSSSSSSSSPQYQHYLSSFSSSKHPFHHIPKSSIHPYDTISTSRQKQEQSDCDFVSTTKESSTIGSPEQMSTEGEDSQRHGPPSSSCSPINGNEFFVKQYKAANELDTTTSTTTKQDEMKKWFWTCRQRLRPHHPVEITISNSDSPGEAASKLCKLSRDYRLSDISPTDTSETIPSLITHISEDTRRDKTSSFSKSSGTRISDFRSTEATATKVSGLSGTERSSFEYLEGDKSPCLPAVTSFTTITTATTTATTSTTPFSLPINQSNSSGESSISMPDMCEVLRRFGLKRPTSKSSSSIPSSEEEKK